jgi:hypothetical protein
MWIPSRYGITNGESVVRVPNVSNWNTDEMCVYLNSLETLVGTEALEQLKEKLDHEAKVRGIQRMVHREI